MLKYNFTTKISERLRNKNILLGINLLCIFFLVKFIFTVIATIKGVLIYDFYHHFDYEYQKIIVNKNLYTHSILLYMPIFISIFSIFKRKIGMIEFTLSLFISYLALKYGWFDIIHNLIKDTFIFDSLRQSGRTIINNQYTRIIFYVLLIIILITQVCSKKTRTLSRIMTLLITTSCLMTVTIFHIAIPMGIFRTVLEEKSQTQKYEIENNSIKDICSKRNCYNIYNSGKIEVISEVKTIDNFKQYEWIIAQGIQTMNKNKSNDFSQPLNVNAGFLFDYDIVAMKKEDNKYFTTIDNISIRTYSRESEIMFSFLAIMAHFTWIFGGLALLEFHYYKFKKRIQRGNVEVKK